MSRPTFAVAAAFAVALALLVSSAGTAEAEILRRDTSTDPVSYVTAGADNAKNGDTRYSHHASSDGFVQFEISTTGAAAASFTHSDATDNGQKIICNAAVTGSRNDCDVRLADDGASPPVATEGVTVAIKIDNDSGAGIVFVKQTRLTGVGGDEEITEAISVTVAQVPSKITVKAASTSINSGQGAAPAGTTVVNIRLLDENNKGIAGKRLTVVSTRALLSAVTGTDDALTVGDDTIGDLPDFDGDGTLAGSVTTSTDPTANDDDSAGHARVLVTGGGSPGISTITVTYSDVTGSEDIVLHGPVKTISAEAQQSAIEVGGVTYIVVTALDSAGNPVKGQHADVKQVGGVTPPSKGAVRVEQNNTTAKNGGDRTKFGTGDYPACGTVPTPGTDDPDTDFDETTLPPSDGTNDKGQCVIWVKAGGEDTTTTTDDAARGTHTIVVVASEDGADGPRGVNEVTLDIQVGGAPATISSDAPERIDPSSEITINLTVLDDEAVRVGGVTIEAFQTAGSGKIITEIGSKTSDGRAKFTYLAPSTPGVVEFLVRTRTKPADEAGSKVTAQLPIIIAIAEEAPPEPPAPPTPEISVSGQSGLIGVSDAGSLEDLLGALDCGGNAGTTVTLNGGTYIVGAPDVVNAAFLSNVSFPIEFGAAYVNCR